MSLPPHLPLFEIYILNISELMATFSFFLMDQWHFIPDFRFFSSFLFFYHYYYYYYKEIFFSCWVIGSHFDCLFLPIVICFCLWICVINFPTSTVRPLKNKPLFDAFFLLKKKENSRNISLLFKIMIRIFFQLWCCGSSGQ